MYLKYPPPVFSAAPFSLAELLRAGRNQEQQYNQVAVMPAVLDQNYLQPMERGPASSSTNAAASRAPDGTFNASLVSLWLI